MRDKVNYNKIQSFGIFATLFLSLVGFGVFTYTQNIGKILGNNAFIPTIIYGIIYLIFVKMIYEIVKINKFSSLDEIIENSFGRIFGRGILFILSFAIIFLVSIELRVFIESIKIYILPDINSQFMVGITLLVSYYVVRQGDKVLIGLNEIMFVFLLISCLVILIIIYKNVDITNLLPVTIKSSGNYFKGFLTLGSYFSGIIMLFYLLPMYKFVDKKKVHVGYKSIIFSFIFLAFVFLICVSVLNIKQTINAAWPIILAFTTIDISGGFVERIEGIIITISIIFFLMNFINLYFYSSYLNSKSLGMYRHKVSSTMFIPIIYILTLLPQNLNDINFIIDKIVFLISLVIVFVIPIILFIISYIKKFFRRGGEKK